MNENFLLGAAILMEIPIAMVLLSRILNYRTNRWANRFNQGFNRFGSVYNDYSRFFRLINTLA